MARLKLSDPSQPFFVRSLLSLYEFFASLKLAVVLILLVAILLGVATFVEANYGTAAVGFLIYHTWFFAALLSLLALNIFCAAAIRFPWKRHQTGFVITHIGLLTLLAGSAISDRGSINSQMLVFLGESNHVAIDMDQSLINVSGIPGRPEPLQTRFQPGPFNWSDLAPFPIVRRIKSWFGLDDFSKPWVHPPQVLFDDGKTKVEVVDYYSRSEARGTPYLALKFNQSKLKFEIPVDLEFDTRHADLPFARGALGRQGEVLMWRSSEPDALAAFKECIPNQTVDGEGLVAFWNKGETYSASIKELKLLKDKGKRFTINDRISVELSAYAESADFKSLVQGKGLIPQPAGSEGGIGPTVELFVYEKIDGKETKYRIVRFSQLPFLPEGRRPAGFHAEYYNPKVGGQIDILIGPDNKLAFRAWQQKAGRVVAAGDLDIGKTVDTWSMGGGEMVWRMTPVRFIPAPPALEEESARRDNVVIIPLPFDKGDHGESKRVNIRISWTDSQGRVEQDTFWLKQNLPEPWENPRRRQVHDTNDGRDKPIRTSYNVQETEVGFALKLLDFDLEVDPGTKMAANYTSRVVQVDVRNDSEVRRLRERIDDARTPEEKQARRDELAATIQKKTDDYVARLQGKSTSEQRAMAQSDEALADFVITMNKPLDYPDPAGRQLRFFQENYIAPDKAQGTALGSVFRVNYDPGRPVKYLGSGLIVFGIFLMFYMRAYFFKRPAKGSEL